MPKSIRTHASRPVSAMRTHAVDAVIPAMETTTDVIDLEGGARRIHGIAMPAAWDAASITFLVAADDTLNWLPLYNGVDPVMVVAGGGAAANLAISLEYFEALAGWPYVIIQSGTHALAVAQTAERTLRVLTVEWT